MYTVKYIYIKAFWPKVTRLHRLRPFYKKNIFFHFRNELYMYAAFRGPWSAISEPFRVTIAPIKKAPAWYSEGLFTQTL